MEGIRLLYGEVAMQRHNGSVDLNVVVLIKGHPFEQKKLFMENNKLISKITKKN